LLDSLLQERDIMRDFHSPGDLGCNFCIIIWFAVGLASACDGGELRNGVVTLLTPPSANQLMFLSRLVNTTTNML